MIPKGRPKASPASAFAPELQAMQSIVEVSQTIQCPYCGQSFDLAIDTSTPAQEFTTDCEVCCRPLGVAIECDAGQVLSLEVRVG